jgi:hypothetical protein
MHAPRALSFFRHSPRTCSLLRLILSPPPPPPPPPPPFVQVYILGFRRWRYFSFYLSSFCTTLFSRSLVFQIFASVFGTRRDSLALSPSLSLSLSLSRVRSLSEEWMEGSLSFSLSVGWWHHWLLKRNAFFGTPSQRPALVTPQVKRHEQLTPENLRHMRKVVKRVVHFFLIFRKLAS